MRQGNFDVTYLTKIIMIKYYILCRHMNSRSDKYNISLTGQAGMNERRNMKIEIVNLDRTQIHGREEKRRVGTRKQTIPSVGVWEIVQRIMTIERQRH